MPANAPECSVRLKVPSEKKLISQCCISIGSGSSVRNGGPAAAVPPPAKPAAQAAPNQKSCRTNRSIELLLNGLDRGATRQPYLGHGVTVLDCRHNANRTITRIRTHGLSRRVAQRNSRGIHGLILFFSVFEILITCYWFCFFDSSGFVIDDHFVNFPPLAVYTESCSAPSSISNLPEMGLPSRSPALRPCSR